MFRFYVTNLLAGFFIGCSVFDPQPSINVQLHTPNFNPVPDTIRIGEGIRVRAELTGTRHGITSYRFELYSSDTNFAGENPINHTTLVPGNPHRLSIDTLLVIPAGTPKSDEAGIYTFGLVAQNGKDESGKRALFILIR